MTFNIVTNYQINTIIKQNSKYYKINLGQSITMEDRSGDRILNKNDQFAFVYNHHYKASILKQGSIGDIDFYTDHLITDSIFRFYVNNEEFIYEFDYTSIKEKGIDFYLGNILKSSKESYSQIQKDKIEMQNIKRGNGKKVLTNPGAVRYEDLKAYMDEKNTSRLKK
jgi:hypothetical protein